MKGAGLLAAVNDDLFHVLLFDLVIRIVISHLWREIILIVIGSYLIAFS
jgi:hypothetical protein